MWTKVKLGDLCELLTKGTTPTSVGFKFESSGINFIKIESISLDGTFIPSKFASINQECNQALKRSQLKEGDLLFSIAGALGRTAIVTAEILPANTNQALAILRLKKDVEVDKRFLLYMLSSQSIKRQSEDYKAGVAQQNLSLGQLKNYEISFPSLEEQRNIVVKLDSIFSEIDRLVALKNYEYKNSTKIFDNNLSKIFQDKSSTWEKESLKNICLKIGSGATPKGGKESYKNEGISLIRSMNVRDLFFKEKDLAKIDDEQAQKLSNVEVKVDDVLLNITGASVARCCLVKNNLLPARINQHVSIIRLKEKTVIPKFLMYGLVSKPYKDELLHVGESNGATRQAITKKQIEEFQFKYPKDLDLQKIIIDKLDKIHSLCLRREEIYNNEIRNYKALKLSFLSRELKSETK